MSRLKTLIGNITQDPSGPMVKPNSSAEDIASVGSAVAGIESNQPVPEEPTPDDSASEPSSSHSVSNTTTVVNSGKSEYDGHFDPAVFGNSNRKDSYVYDQVTRDVVAKNYMEKLAEENGMSVEDIEKILNEPVVENESNKEGIVYRLLGEMKPENEAQADKIASILSKKVDKQSIRDKYNEYMQGYDEHVEYINSLDSDVISMNTDYDTAIDKAHQEIDTYIEAREAISGFKDRMSPEAYAKLESGLIESNHVIAKSIGEYFPDCSEGKFANPDKESGLSGIDFVTPYEPIEIVPDDPEEPIVPSFPWDKPEPQYIQSPYYPYLAQPGQMINYDDKSNEGSSSLKNALGKVTDKVTEFGQKITSSFDKVVDNNKTNRGHEFDDIVAESSNDIQLDK